MKRLDFYCKVSQDGSLSVWDADRLIEIMKEGRFCVLPSDNRTDSTAVKDRPVSTCQVSVFT